MSNNKNIINFLKEISEKNIKLYLDEGALRLLSDTIVEASLLAQIKENKNLLIDFLSNEKGQLKIDKSIPNISIQERSGKIPLSFAQERLWFIDKLQGSVQYHQPTVLRLNGKLDRVVLEDAFRELVSRHEVFRTIIKEEEGVGYQEILDANRWEMNYVNDKTFIEDKDLEYYIDELIAVPYNLSTESVFRVHLIRLIEDEHILLVMTHHIGSDGWSQGVMIDEFVQLYNALEEGRKIILPELPIQYADYAIWQRNYLSGDVLETKLDYWNTKLSGVESLELTTDYVRPAIQSTRGATTGVAFDSSLSSQVKYLSIEKDVTLFMFLLSVFKVLLYKYSGQGDLCVGSPTAGRTQQELEGLIGFFINTLVLRSTFNGDTRFTDLLDAVKETTLGAYDHQDVPFEKIVDDMSLERDVSRSPLFQTMFVLQNVPESKEALSMDGIEINIKSNSNITSRFDLTFTISEFADTIHLEVTYCTDLFEESTITRMLVHYEELLRSVLKDSECMIGDLNMLTEDEKHELLAVFNATEVSYPKEKTVIDLFESQVKLVPDSIALVYEDSVLTYEALDKRSNQLTHYFQEKGIISNSLVGLCLDQSIEFVVGMLGILKYGCGFIPVDFELPMVRIESVLTDSGVELVLTDTKNISVLKDIPFSVFNLEDNYFESLKTEKTGITLDQNSLAYCIYTSGTTGVPKGVLISHKGLIDYVYGLFSTTNIESSSSFALLSTITADLGYTTLFTSLLTGGGLHLFDKTTLKNSSYLHHYFNLHPIDCFKVVPAYWLALGISGHYLLPRKKIIFGGDVLPKAILTLIESQSNSITVINHYGPTETTIGKLLYQVKGLKEDSISIPIGKPFSNTTIYVVNSSDELCPIGVPGKLLIGGSGIALGYLNQPELTATMFIENLFSERSNSKLYKTGDTVRWNRSGNIEFIGRTDNQVKIRGYRIELGEIESVLNGLPEIKQGVILAKANEKENKRLVGYVVVEGEFNKETLQGQLKAKLPEYMVPSLWVELEALPLTNNGKIDKKSLPDLDMGTLSNKKYVAPRSPLEKQLAGIWQDILGVERVGLYDNFFELGGDSIVTIRMVSRSKRLGYDFRPRDLFENPTVFSLAGQVNKGTKILGEQGGLEGVSGLLPIQQLYFDRALAVVSHYNQSVLLSVSKTVSFDVLSSVVKGLVSHHDALRFVYSSGQGIWDQSYGTAAGVLELEDLSAVVSEGLTEGIEGLCRIYQGSLDIKKGTICRFVLLKTPESESHNRLFITIHHLAVDGVSWRIILNDLEVGVNLLSQSKGLTFGSKSSSYREWYLALQEYSLRRSVAPQILYWKKAIKAYKELPVDTIVAEVPESSIVEYSINLSSEMTRFLLQEVNGAYHTNINTILLSALALTIGDWTAHSSIVIGLEGHGREDISGAIDLSRTVGWFTSLYPVLLTLDKDLSLGSVIKSVKEQLRVVPDKGIGYGALRYLHPLRATREELATIDPFDLIFNYLGQFDNVLEADGIFKGASESSGANVSNENSIKNKLSFNGAISDGTLGFEISYSTLQYNASTIEKLGDAYIHHLESLIVHCKSKDDSEKTPSDYVGFKGLLGYASLTTFLNTESSGIKRRDLISRLYGLSPLQEGLLFHGLYGEDSGAYMEQLEVSFYDLNTTLFKASWDYLLDRFSILRTGFYYEGLEEPLQCVYKKVVLPFEILDYRNMSGSAQAERLASFKAADIQKGFDFGAAPLMRISLIRISEREHILLWTNHHLILDGWSRSILMGEFLSVYEALSKEDDLPAVTEDIYEDYLRYIDKKKRYVADAHWEDYLSGIERPSLLPFVTGVKDRNTGEGLYKEDTLVLDKKETSIVKAYVQSKGLTVNSLVQGVWGYLLSKYSGEASVLYGVTVSGRPDDMSGIETRVGLYINTLPLCVTVSDSASIESWLQGIQKGHTLSREYQYSSLSELQRITGITGDLFDSLLVFENYPISEVMHNGPDGDGTDAWALEAGTVSMEEQTNYLLTLSAGLGAELGVTFSYNSEMLDKKYVLMIQGHFRVVMDQIVNRSVNKVGDLDMLTRKEKRELLDVFNATDVAYPKEKTVVDLFEAQVESVADSIALVYEDNVLTYKVLNERSNQLGHYLKSRSVEPSSLVGICMDRSLDMVIGILGVLKSGGAYVPIDPEYPEDRIDYMLSDTGIGIVLSTGSSADVFKVQNELLIEDLDRFVYTNYPSANLNTNLTSDSLAYVIYTSGSTGKPKGSMNNHSGIYNRLQWAQETFNLTVTDVVLQKTTFCFDVSIWELIWPLLFGSRLVFASPGGEKDTEYLKGIIDYNRITTIHFVPSMLDVFLSSVNEGDCSSLKRVLCSGEVLQYSQALLFKTNLGAFASLYNLYGPTEAAIDVTFCEVSEEVLSHNTVPIGVPVSNTQTYILDSNLKLLPKGVTGELYIGGIQVSRGYLNRPNLTKEKFIESPFKVGDTIYKTGDLVRWNSAGNLEYIGRTDNQVKIRGYRIELGEIESVLHGLPEINQGVVLAKADEKGNKRLVGYVVSQGVFKKEPVQLQLKAKLPDYMVPSLWVELEALPLTSNGKINRRRLPALNMEALTANTYVAPRNNEEKQLAEIWQDVLGVDRVGIHDNFFELGGHSLSIMRLKNRIKEHLGIRINVSTLYNNSTIEMMVVHIFNEEKASSIPFELLQKLTNVETNSYKYTIIGIPYLSGDATVFKTLAREIQNINSKVDFYAMNIPREAEEFQDMNSEKFDVMVAQLLEEVKSKIKTPILIWGHSAGSTFGSYLFKVLEANGYDLLAFCSGGAIPYHLERKNSKDFKFPTEIEIKNRLIYTGLEKVSEDFREDDWGWILRYSKYDHNFIKLSRNAFDSKFQIRELNSLTYLVMAKDDPATNGWNTEFRASFYDMDNIIINEIEKGGHYFIKTQAKEIALFLNQIIKV